MMRLQRWAAVLGIAWALLSCGNQVDTVTLSGPTMGSHYSVRIAGLPADVDAADLQREVQALLDTIEGVASHYKKDSELSQINADVAGRRVLSPMMAQILAFADAQCEFTGGALDVSVGELVNLWGFGSRDASDPEPPANAIDSARSLVGCDALRVDGLELERSRAVTLDVSSVTQGIAGEEIAKLLEAKGVSNYLIDMSGELLARGNRPDGKPWRVGVEAPDPRAAVGAHLQKVVQPGNGAVATSGDYRNYREHEGKRYSHLIDPRTGRPVIHALASVTVIDTSLSRADALSTALMVMGPVDGLAFAEKHGVAAMFLIRGGEGFEERMTGGFGQRVVSLAEQ